MRGFCLLGKDCIYGHPVQPIKSFVLNGSAMILTEERKNEIIMRFGIDFKVFEIIGCDRLTIKVEPKNMMSTNLDLNYPILWVYCRSFVDLRVDASGKYKPCTDECEIKRTSADECNEAKEVKDEKINNRLWLFYDKDKMYSVDDEKLNRANGSITRFICDMKMREIVIERFKEDKWEPNLAKIIISYVDEPRYYNLESQDKSNLIPPWKYV